MATIHAWNINGTYIGANHGCSDARELTCPNHGRTVADLGTVWQDEAGAKFVILKIADANHLWVMSTNSSRGSIWQFNTKVTGASLKPSGAT